MMIDEDNSTVKDLAKQTVSEIGTMLFWFSVIMGVFCGIYWLYNGHPYQPIIPLNKLWEMEYYHYVGDTTILFCMMLVLFCGYVEFIKSEQVMLWLFIMIGVFAVVTHIWFDISYFPQAIGAYK